MYSSVFELFNHKKNDIPGCRSTSFNLEGRSLTSWSTSRHCVVARIQDITIDQFMEIRNKAGALLLVLPRNDTLLNEEEKEVNKYYIQQVWIKNNRFWFTSKKWQNRLHVYLHMLVSHMWTIVSKIGVFKCFWFQHECEVYSNYFSYLRKAYKYCKLN